MSWILAIDWSALFIWTDAARALYRLVTLSLLISLLFGFSACTYTKRVRQDAIGDSTESYSLSWGEPTATPEPYRPARQVSQAREYPYQPQAIERAEQGS